MGVKQFDSSNTTSDLERYNSACYHYFTSDDSRTQQMWQSAYQRYHVIYNQRENGRISAIQLTDAMSALADYLGLLADCQKRRAGKSIQSFIAPGSNYSAYRSVYSQARSLKNHIEILRHYEDRIIAGESLMHELSEAKKQMMAASMNLQIDIGRIIDNLATYRLNQQELGKTHPYNIMAAYIEYAMADMRAGIAHATNMAIPDEKGLLSYLPMNRIEARDAQLQTPKERMDIDTAISRLRIIKPKLYKWMVLQGFKEPLESQPRQNLDKGEVAELRNEITKLYRETSHLNWLAETLLRQPGLTSQNSREARREAGKFKIHLAKEGEEYEQSAPPPVVPVSLHIATEEDLAKTGASDPKPNAIDPHEGQRPYDTFTIGKSSVSLKTVNDNLTGLGHKIDSLVSREHPEKKELIDMVIACEANYGLMMRHLDIMAVKMKEYLAENPVEPTNGSAQKSTTPRSTLLPVSRDAVEFTIGELYPRIAQNADRLLSAIKELEAMYRQEVGTESVDQTFLSRREAEIGRAISPDGSNKAGRD